MFNRIKTLCEKISKCISSDYKIQDAEINCGLDSIEITYSYNNETLYIEQTKYDKDTYYICLRSEPKIFKGFIRESGVRVSYVSGYEPKKVYNSLDIMLSNLEEQVKIINGKISEDINSLVSFEKELNNLF